MWLKCQTLRDTSRTVIHTLGEKKKRMKWTLIRGRSFLRIFFLWGSTWTARRSNQSIRKEISVHHWVFIGRTDAETETQHGHLMWRVDSLEKTLMLGGIGGRRRRGQQRMGWLDGITDLMGMTPIWWAWIWVNSRSWWWTGRPGMLQFMGLQRVGHDWATELNWC